MSNKPDVLIIDDDAALAEMLALNLDDLGYSTELAHTGAEARAFLTGSTPRLILLDQHLPDTHGIKLLQWIITEKPETPAVMVTGFHDMSLAISAMKAGAFDYLHKPINMEKLEEILKQTLSKSSQKIAVNVAPEQENDTPEIVGNSQSMLDVAKKIAIAAQNKANVLVQGASGTGKELVARAIHKHSTLDGPFVAVNCASIVETLLESELFGHEKGAFTGADQTKQGRFEVAEDGTLFLDEIGEMSAHLQAKLLRVLQEQTFERVGSNQTRKTNARIIAATHRDLKKMVAEGKFREDLFYRLDVIDIKVPALKDRMEDFPALASNLLMRINKTLGRDIKGLTSTAMDVLKGHNWDGNVRELENVLTRAAAHSQNLYIDYADVAKHLTASKEAPASTPTSSVSVLRSMADVEKEHILAVLDAHEGNKAQACKTLGISRPALDRRLKRWKIS